MAELNAEINKRMTLNLLIQGSSTHAFLTSHYLVTNELNAIHPGLLKLYDKFSLAAMMSSWIGVSSLIHGKPSRFWGSIHKTKHPFNRHPFLVRHGPELAAAARRHTEKRSREKGVLLIPVAFSFQVRTNYRRIKSIESRHIPRLEELAKTSTCAVWGIDRGQLDATITPNVAFGKPRKPTTAVARGLRNSAVGYGGVLRTPSGLKAVARAVAWPLLSHELVKGVVELICMHGLNTLDRETYLKVVDYADQIEFEPWMIQSGTELWRRFLAVHPVDAHLATTIMYVARLSPDELDSLMFDVIERPEQARKTIEQLG